MSIRRGDIYYIESTGYMATGSEQYAGRPAIVVSNEKNNEFSRTIEVVYLTTQPKADLPTHIDIRSAKKPSVALREQITSVAVERLGDYVGTCTEQEMQRIDTALLISLAIECGKTDIALVDKQSCNAASDDEYEKVKAQRDAILVQRDTIKAMYDRLLDKIVAER